MDQFHVTDPIYKRKPKTSIKDGILFFSLVVLIVLFTAIL